jgi:hypothetical protein
MVTSPSLVEAGTGAAAAARIIIDVTAPITVRDILGIRNLGILLSLPGCSGHDMQPMNRGCKVAFALPSGSCLRDASFLSAASVPGR